jgi:hypothetical protein
MTLSKKLGKLETKQKNSNYRIGVQNMENEYNVLHEFTESLYDFNQVSFSDYVDADTFKVMARESIDRCFENGEYLPFMVDASVCIGILKYCSNFPTEEFTNEQMYEICTYSNLKEVINTLESSFDCQLSFIVQNLQDAIFYERDKALNRSKLDELIGELVDFAINNSEDIKEIVSSVAQLTKEDSQAQPQEVE